MKEEDTSWMDQPRFGGERTGKPWPVATDGFSPGNNRIFATSLGAQFYAWQARRRGFQTDIHDYGAYQRELGGRYEVRLSV